MRRLTEILAAEAASTAGTKVIDLNIIDLISRITVVMKGTNSTGVPTAHPAKMISKIELVDGSDVLFSLSGIECQALNFYETGELPENALMYVNDVQCMATFHIHFGRYLWDKILALDPSRFSNLQLKITHNKASGGGAPDAGELGVYADLMSKEDASPVGFLMAKEIQSYALTSSAHEYISLPTDYPFRKLIIASLAAAKQPWEQYNKIKLSIDNDRIVLINNLSVSALAKFLPGHRRFTEFLVGTGTGSAEGTYCTPAMWAFAASGALVSAQTANGILTQIYGGYFTALMDSAEIFQLLISGKAPHGAIEIPFGDQTDIETWLKTAKIGSLKLDVTAGSSVLTSSTAEIVSQQLRNYK
jgi:hypothetical protein